ncbi:nucleotidyltransferase family protein [Paucisalibacillus sp. EB02]|uniref:nucleotidyltransferase family protein n=1 Tax=Paucisalibacillus sp. EB02 TaxID=1347087 RepID=UPI0005A8E61B|nr:nucleotidyltransferase family protein [Paucisalibacillus sp. EB02]
MLENEKDIVKVFYNDKEMMAILRVAQSLNLPDWWICAGFVRSRIWDVLHGFSQPTPLDDVDLVYFDPIHTDEAKEKELEQKLNSILPTVPWSVKNEARMHLVNGLEPYKDTVDAISKFPETVTSLGIKLDENDSIRLTFPHGIEDVLNMTVQPTPFFAESNQRMKIYHYRIRKKKWHEKWIKVTYLVE